MRKDINVYLIGIFVVTLIFSSPFVFKDKIPIPADTILGMYHPWRDQVWDDFTAGLPFKNFLITDPVRQQYIWKKLAIESYKIGKLPLWNPYTHSGMPLLANFQTGALYPLNFLFFIFDFNFAWGVFILLQPFLASFFMFLFLKESKLSSKACFLGAITFAFSGFMTAWLEWGNLGHTALWLPLILLSIEKVINNLYYSNSGRSPFSVKMWGIVLVFSLSASFFAGHLQTFFYLLIFSFFYIIWKILKKKKKRRLILLFTVYCLLFTIITSIQWLPTLEFIKFSAREIDQASLINQSGWFLPFKHLIQFFAPDFFGNPTTMNYFGEWNYGELVGYIGVIPLIFALYAFLQKKFSFWSAVLLVCFLFILPTPIAKLPFLLKIPFISTSQPTRLLFIIGFCLAVLAALGLDYFWKNQKRKNLECAAYGLLFTFMLLWVLAFLQNLKVTQRNLILPTGIFFLFLISSLFITKKKRFITFYLLFIIFLTIFDLLRFSFKFNPFVKKEWIFPETETIKFLKQDNSLWRMMTLDRRLFPPNFSAAYQIQTIEGYDPLYLKDYGCLITKVESGEDTQSCGAFNRIIRPVNFASGIIDELNVKYILSLEEVSHPKMKKVFQEGETRVYENLSVKPRVTVGQGSIRGVDYQAQEIKVDLVSNQETELILRDIYYSGWQAEIDGQKTQVLKTNLGLRKIMVPGGEHQVRFYYPLF